MHFAYFSLIIAKYRYKVIANNGISAIYICASMAASSNKHIFKMIARIFKNVVGGPVAILIPKSGKALVEFAATVLYSSTKNQLENIKCSKYIKEKITGAPRCEGCQQPCLNYQVISYRVEHIAHNCAMCKKLIYCSLECICSKQTQSLLNTFLVDINL